MIKPLLVTLDVSSVPYGRGVSRYTSNLARALVVQSGVQVTLFGVSWQHFDELEAWMSEFGSHVRKLHYKLPPKVLFFLWKHKLLPLSCLDASHGVFHAWEWQVPFLSHRSAVVTIHDLAHLLYPEVAHPEVVTRFDRLLRLLEKNTQPIIAVSQATKNDIVRLTSIIPERVHVVYEALPEEVKIVPSKEQQKEILEKYALNRPFYLIVGTREPRKNMKRMIEAWQSLDTDLECVVVGAPGWDELPKTQGLHILNYLDPTELSTLYIQAQALVYASLYEGFGLPILEAFFHGCPVVTSRVSSLPEVAGDAAFYCDPYSVESIAEAISLVPRRTTDQYRTLAKNMSHQLSQFSWSRAANETLEVYRLAEKKV